MLVCSSVTAINKIVLRVQVRWAPVPCLKLTGRAHTLDCIVSPVQPQHASLNQRYCYPQDCFEGPGSVSSSCLLKTHWESTHLTALSAQYSHNMLVWISITAINKIVLRVQVRWAPVPCLKLTGRAHTWLHCQPQQHASLQQRYCYQQDCFEGPGSVSSSCLLKTHWESTHLTALSAQYSHNMLVWISVTAIHKIALRVQVRWAPVACLKLTGRAHTWLHCQPSTATC